MKNLFFKNQNQNVSYHTNLLKFKTTRKTKNPSIKPKGPIAYAILLLPANLKPCFLN